MSRGLNQKTLDEAQENPSYFIDLAWYEEQGRSFPVLAESRLCPPCRARYAQMKGEGHPPSDLLGLVCDCCAHSPDFISPARPLIELIFRLFLISGNQLLELEEIQRRLQEQLGSLSMQRDLSLRTLKHLLDHDRYYGLRPPRGPEGSLQLES